jgi:lysine-ketoglutarate reductase/saccharopine dehydrogenase-like protein (TIGR00300 family)
MSAGHEADASPLVQEIEVEGHLIDSMILTKIFDLIMDHKGEFEVLEFRIGKRKGDYSYARLAVRGDTAEQLARMMRELLRLGATVPQLVEAELAPAPRDRVPPDGFYSTTNHPTAVYVGGRWIDVENLKMDRQIVVHPDASRARCRPLLEVQRGDLVVVGELGIRIRPPERPREGVGIFEFMNSKVSSEKPSLSIVREVARDLHRARQQGQKIVFVPGPAVVHTGAAAALATIIRLGYVSALLSGNALAVHDVEYSLYGTSLGMDLTTGATTGSHRYHLAAIVEVIKAGSLRAMVTARTLTRGIFYQCIVNDVPYALAGSIRDDGPIPDVITDSIAAQRRYAELAAGADVVVMLASMLHAIAVGNILPSTVKVICVDINPAVTTKLTDRGTAHAVGIVSDVGAFLPLLADELKRLHAA